MRGFDLGSGDDDDTMSRHKNVLRIIHRAMKKCGVLPLAPIINMI